MIAALGALHARLADGVGQRIDVSALESMVTTMATCLPTVTYAGQVPVAGGNRAVCPWGIYALRDGRVLVQCTEDGQWRALVGMLGDPEWGHLDLFATTAQRSEQYDAVEALVAATVADFDVEEFLTTAHAVGVPACRVHTPADVLAWEQLRARDSFRRLAVDAWCRRRGARAADPVRRAGSRSVTSTCRRSRADDGTVDWVPRPAVTVGPPAIAPLAGLRVIDLTWVWAGPFAAMQLAHLGADVIKIESRGRIDVTRRLGPFVDEEPGIDRSGYFNQFNQGKRSVCLDPTTDDGRALLARLLAGADVVIDNMRAGALARMGFDDAPPARAQPAHRRNGHDRLRRDRAGARQAGLRIADRRPGGHHGGDGATGRRADGDPDVAPRPERRTARRDRHRRRALPPAHARHRRRHGVLDARGLARRAAVGRADDERRRARPRRCRAPATS